jgi:NAD(P)-dependent dehydrogenase (short-subunit alcohol dehydrogenase family)
MAGTHHGEAVFVTGAGSGIGRALCLAFASRGAHVTATDVDGEALAQTRLLAGRDARIEKRVLDVRDAADFQRAVEEAWAVAPIDVFVNNAGVGVGGELLHLSLEDWRRVLDVNLHGVIHGVQAVYGKMAARHQGKIVNVASIAGLVPTPLLVPYATSKHAVVGLSLSLRAEAVGHGVQVNVACPQAVDTPIWHSSTLKGKAVRTFANNLRKMSVNACAARILSGIDDDEPVILVGTEAHALALLQRVAPGVASAIGRLVARAARKVATTA